MKPPKEKSPALVRSPSVRTFSEWTPRSLRAAERLADAGDLSRAASVCEWLLSDDRVSGALETRLDALFGLVPQFEAGVGRRGDAAVKALEAGEDFWTSYPEATLRILSMWGILLGVAPAHQSWPERRGHGGRVLPRLSFWHPQTLRYAADRDEWSLQNTLHQRVTVTPGDAEWVLHAPYGTQRPWAFGLWRSLGRWLLLKQYAVQDWARHSEKSALLVATSPEGATHRQRKELAQDLGSVGEDAVVALAAGFDLKLVEVSANTKQIYESQVALADLAISIRIRGANLATNVESGSKAAAQSQQKTSTDPKLRFDAAAISTTLHDQSLIWWSEFNFGDAALAPWPKYPVEPAEDRRARADMINVLGDGLGKLDRLGVEIDISRVVEEFGLTFVTGRRTPLPLPTPEKPGLRARLASGQLASEASGFLNGQLWADAHVESATAAAETALRPTVDAILEELDAAVDYEDLRARLRTRYVSLSADELSFLVEKSMTLAQLAGRAAVLEDL